MSQHIICPNCKFEIDLDKIADEKYLQKLKEQEEKLKKEQEIQREKFEKEMEEKTEEMRKKAQEFAQKKADEARKELELEMKDMQNQLKKAEEEKLEAKKKELEFLKKQREIEEKEKNFELEMEKKLFEERKKIEDSISEKLKENSKKELDEKMASLQEEFRKKELEYQKQQEQLKKSLDDAKRKAEQGSQQIQWDISENDLKDALIHAFPIDSIEDVATLVKNNFWQVVWTIVWESKNTKSWSESWVMKLKEDTLKVWWNVSILVTAVLPKDIKNFWIYDDIMVCTPEFAVSVAAILRDKILSISKVEKSLEWKDLKMELLYKYLTSQEFSSKINMMIQVFTNLKAWIDSERRAMEKNWKKREKDLERATFAITWMYWELESLMWQALPWAEILELGSWEDEDLD